MKKVSQKNLKKIIDAGWEVDEITSPKPKEPLLKDMVAKSIDRVSVENQKVIGALAAKIEEFIDAQSNKKEKEMKIKVEFPKSKKKTWEFKVNRDGKGFIENVIAQEL